MNGVGSAAHKESDVEMEMEMDGSEQVLVLPPEKRDGSPHQLQQQQRLPELRQFQDPAMSRWLQQFHWFYSYDDAEMWQFPMERHILRLLCVLGPHSSRQRQRVLAHLLVHVMADASANTFNVRWLPMQRFSARLARLSLLVMLCLRVRGFPELIYGQPALQQLVVRNLDSCDRLGVPFMRFVCEKMSQVLTNPLEVVLRGFSAGGGGGTISSQSMPLALPEICWSCCGNRRHSEFYGYDYGYGYGGAAEKDDPQDNTDSRGRLPCEWSECQLDRPSCAATLEETSRRLVCLLDIAQRALALPAETRIHHPSLAEGTRAIWSWVGSTFLPHLLTSLHKMLRVFALVLGPDPQFQKDHFSPFSSTLLFPRDSARAAIVYCHFRRIFSSFFSSPALSPFASGSFSSPFPPFILDPSEIAKQLFSEYARFSPRSDFEKRTANGADRDALSEVSGRAQLFHRWAGLAWRLISVLSSRNNCQQQQPQNLAPVLQMWGCLVGEFQRISQRYVLMLNEFRVSASDLFTTLFQRMVLVGTDPQQQQQQQPFLEFAITIDRQNGPPSFDEHEWMTLWNQLPEFLQREEQPFAFYHRIVRRQFGHPKGSN